jgi:hypothetical protein
MVVITKHIFKRIGETEKMEQTLKDIIMDYVTILINLILAGIVGFLFWKLQQSISVSDMKRTEESKKVEEKLEKQEECREEFNIILLKNTRASICLARATAIALRDGKANGEVTQALIETKEVEKDCTDFITKKGINNIIK